MNPFRIAAGCLVGLTLFCLNSRGDVPARLPDVHEAMAEFVANKEIAGAVTVVATRDRVRHIDAVGHASIKAATPMRPDSLMWVASMTKPITATAIMMLADEGKLRVDDPVAKHLPEFASLDNITLKHLLTHTSGLADKPRGASAKTLGELVALYPKQPVRFAPGSKWEYSNPGINTLGRIVEVVSGTEFEKFLQDRLFQPLGMRDTTFHPSPEQVGRLATSYKRTDAGELEETVIHILLGGVKYPPPDSIPYPAGGLFSTATDLTRFYQMMLRGGEFDGRRFLSRESFKEMTRVQTGDLKCGFVDGMGFGFGWGVVKQPQGPTAMLSAGAFGHGGAYGTQAWLDPAKNRAFLLMVQRANFPNADASDVRRVFQQTAAAAAGPE